MLSWPIYRPENRRVCDTRWRVNLEKSITLMETWLTAVEDCFFSIFEHEIEGKFIIYVKMHLM